MSSTLRRLLLTLIGLGVALAGPTLAIDRDAPATLIEHMDALWIDRAAPERVPQILEAGRRILANDPSSYDAAWRMARAYWFLARTATGERRGRESALAGMRYALTAIELNPDRVEGHFMYALSVADYATALTPVEAVVEGVASKFERAALAAYRRDRSFDHGGPIIALGRYYFELPWPMRDLRRSRRYLEEAQRLHPESLYARVYLAETYYALGEEERAKQEVDSVLAAPSGSHDAPETTEPRLLARQALERWFPEDTQLLAASGGE